MMISGNQINNMLQKNVLNGVKISHSTSQPVIFRDEGKYYLAVFVFFYTKEDIQTGRADRPSLWAVADLETGEIVEKYECKDRDFSDADFDKKYNIRSDTTYDTSKKYYDEAFAILDSVREKLIKTGKFYGLEYQYYLKRILANIPKEYQRFYTELSV